eukprot:TRINITY_DN836_c1_g1_i1.p1 TRINITY_DN836_c1_g1~~TRINITY_DN836_c1_g1_i1.p1  ORF type:complete len:814 (+),score=246.65 TRINITY_DN836_c1_g1_i1:55-2442(+)
MRAAAAAALLVLRAQASGVYVEVPAVATVPIAAPSFLAPDDYTPAPTPPLWTGDNGTMGVVPAVEGGDVPAVKKGSMQFWERDIRAGVNITFGVAGEPFRDPDLGMDSLGIKIKSSLEPNIFPTSFAAAMKKPRGGVAAAKISRSTDGCPGDSHCRLVLHLGPDPGLYLPLGNERLEVRFSGRSFNKGKRASPYIFMVTINDDAAKDDLQERLADAIEVSVGFTVLTGSSSPAALLASRLLLLMHVKCGEHHDALDHATNPMEIGVGDGPNRLYLGGLLANLLFAIVPLLVHMVLVCVNLGARKVEPKQPVPASPPQKAGEATSPLLGLVEVGMHSDECKIGGISLTELRQQQATVRYPHYTLVIAIFVYQGVATCAFRLIMSGEDAFETGIGMASLVWYCGSLLALAWWKLGRGEVRRLEAEYVVYLDSAETKSCSNCVFDYLLGPGEWVSNSKARLVHTYACLFEAYREERPGFIMFELILMLPLAVVGTLDADTWVHCVAESVVVCAILAVFLVLCLWWKPWASRFDNHVITGVAALMVVDTVLLAASFSGHDIGNTVHKMFEMLLLALMVVVLLKSCADVILLGIDTVKQRRWKLQEAFEQGQTLYRGRDAYRGLKREQQVGVGEPTDEELEEEERMLAVLAPSAVSAYSLHVLPTAPPPPPGPAPALLQDRNPDAPAGPGRLPDTFDDFLHTADCPVTVGDARLSEAGSALPICPACSAGRPPAPQGGPGQWLRFVSDDGDPYWWNGAEAAAAGRRRSQRHRREHMEGPAAGPACRRRPRVLQCAQHQRG